MLEQTTEWDGEGRPQPSVPSTHGISLYPWVETWVRSSGESESTVESWVVQGCLVFPRGVSL